MEVHRGDTEQITTKLTVVGQVGMAGERASSSFLQAVWCAVDWCRPMAADHATLTTGGSIGDASTPAAAVGSTMGWLGRILKAPLALTGHTEAIDDAVLPQYMVLQPSPRLADGGRDFAAEVMRAAATKDTCWKQSALEDHLDEHIEHKPMHRDISRLAQTHYPS